MKFDVKKYFPPDMVDDLTDEVAEVLNDTCENMCEANSLDEVVLYEFGKSVIAAVCISEYAISINDPVDVDKLGKVFVTVLNYMFEEYSEKVDV